MEINWYLGAVAQILERLDPHPIEELVTELYRAYENDQMVFTLGNGGSAATASHFAQDLSKGVFKDCVHEKRLRALSLTDNVSLISAVANDDGYEHVFEAQLRILGRPGDVVIAISGSGNSMNVIRAAEYARSKSMCIVGVTGYDGGKLRSISDISVHVNLNEMCTVESIHSVMCHLVVNILREKITGTPMDTSCFRVARKVAAS